MIVTKKIFQLLFITLFVSALSAQNNVFDISRTGTVEAISKLYQTNNAIINEVNEEGYSPLTLACYYSNTPVVKFLVDKVASVNGNSKFGTPLMAAVVKGNKEIVHILLQNKADPNRVDHKGTTAAHYAVMFKNYDIIKLLVEAKANFNLKDQNEKSPLDYAILYNDEKINQLLKL